MKKSTVLPLIVASVLLLAFSALGAASDVSEFNAAWQQVSREIDRLNLTLSQRLAVKREVKKALVESHTELSGEVFNPEEITELIRDAVSGGLDPDKIGTLVKTVELSRKLHLSRERVEAMKQAMLAGSTNPEMEELGELYHEVMEELHGADSAEEFFADLDTLLQQAQAQNVDPDDLKEIAKNLAKARDLGADVSILLTEIQAAMVGQADMEQAMEQLEETLDKLEDESEDKDDHDDHHHSSGKNGDDDEDEDGSRPSPQFGHDDEDDDNDHENDRHGRRGHQDDDDHDDDEHSEESHHRSGKDDD